MENKKLTYWDVHRYFNDHEKKELGWHLYCYVVFSNDSFDRDYSENDRTYWFSSECSAFQPGKIANSIYGFCLDGKDMGVRLDRYMADRNDGDGWKVERMWITSEEPVLPN